MKEMATPRQETKRRRMPHPRLQFGTQGALGPPHFLTGSFRNELWLARVHIKVLARDFELAALARLRDHDSAFDVSSFACTRKR